MSEQFYIGIDVGTGSARAGIFNQQGKLISQASHDIQIWKPKTDFVQQSSENIWEAICHSVKQAMAESSLEPKHIAGIGFDATCSLVVLGEENRPLTVSPDNLDEQNIIVWMDHRAKGEAEEINQKGHEVLNYVGGVISPEMQTPKLLWLKRNMPETWEKATCFFDLPDYLVFRATGIDVRSACTTTCKWTYLAHEDSEVKGSIGRWDNSYFQEIGLGDLTNEGYKRIGMNIRPMGEPVGAGLTKQSAEEFGLKPGIPVGVSIIDAHAGGLGLLGMTDNGSTFNNQIALIGGTSSCHMAVSEEPRFIDGIWGPYYSAMIPGLWLNEGGQSATGALIDHVIFSSSHAQELQKEAKNKDTTVYSLLNDHLVDLANKNGLVDVGLLTKDLHVLPYFHGNRSPRADASLLGGIVGLTLSSTIEDLAIQYLATIQAIAYGTRHIIEEMNKTGYTINQISATGGGTKNDLFLKQHADICDCKIILPKESEAVLLGSAVLAAVASGTYKNIQEAMVGMNQTGKVIEPGKNQTVTTYHNSKYKVFHKMYEDERSYKEIMQEDHINA
ncbi:FGGY-family carbohydrate kinase [Rhodohalobacter sulfatireducens]|uniref:FGGY-family carbohydrate kinase n=1 Tax=Rhodohalobacter sulfatireducens TaxID=2911366 RepID=A0ABS9KAF6_9BACT|nr:FGGY-family carbohydrate kinase [Rhodohalobacter sulfatireducens]MCG2587808.1 FGGY-family carbohydrate kinase [Rhodohalobacter sulfatireducens]